MKKKMPVLLLLACGVFIFGCALGGWQKFNSQEGSFTITMPGKPEGYKVIIDTEFGQTYLHLFVLDNEDDFVYSVSFIDHYRELLQKKSVDLILDDARDGAILNVQGRLLSESPISINKYPGREITFESVSGESLVWCKIVLVGSRLYQVMVTAPKEKKSAFNIKRFLNSFKIVENRN